MTTSTTPASGPSGPGVSLVGRERALHPSLVHDTLVVARRNLLRLTRQPQLLVFVVIQPVMFVLLFRYVFGGAIRTAPGLNYVDFLIPGIIVQSVGFGAASTGVGLAEDLNNGIIDRFRSLPMSRLAVLAGRTLSDVVRVLFTVLLMATIGFAVGWRPKGNVVELVAALGIIIVYGFALTWVYAYVGLRLRNAEATQSASFVILFPLNFASSVFVPVATMPGWLQSFARVNPITLTADSVRALTFGTAVGHSWWGALLWIAAIVLFFAGLSVRAYQRIG